MVVERETPLSTGVTRVTLRMLGDVLFSVRPGQFVDVEAASGERERAAVVAVSPTVLDVELHELAPHYIVRMRGPFDTPR